VSNPVNGATAVPTNAIVTVLMNEPVDPLTVTDANFFVQDSQGRIAGAATLSDDARTLTFVPNIALAVRRPHTVYLQGVKDLFGNATSTAFSFTTDFAADAAAPQIVSTSLFSGQTSVPTNATISIRFNEAINRLALTGVVLKQGATVLSVQRLFSADGGGTTVELVPNQPLTANTSYTLSIGAVEDLSGNVLAVPKTVSFTTGTGQDVTAPTLVSRTPISGATGVPRNTQIEAVFSERINPVTVHGDSVKLYNSATGQFMAGVPSLSPDGTAVRFTPSATLAANTTYYLYITYSTYVEDLAGNRISTSWTFTTGTASDSTAPVVQLQSIADGATAIPVNGRFVLQFDAPLADQCVSSQTVQVTSGGTPVTGTLTLSSNRTTLIFTPQAALAANTAYTLRLQGVCDLAGNTLSNFTTGFTTSTSATADTTRPTITATPAQGATNVPVTTSITISFSEPIDVTTLAGGIQVTISGLSGEVAGNLSVNGSVATFTPLEPLTGNKTVFVSVNGVADLAGNTNSGFSRSFTTGAAGDTTAPRILSVVPNDGLVDVAPGSPVVLTFSESLDASTVNGASFALFVNGEIVRPSISRSQDNRTIVLTAGLPASSVVSVIVTSDVHDLSGNPLADFVSAFTTATATNSNRPSVVTQFPGQGANGVLPDAAVVLYTNKAMSASTLQQALHVSQNGVLVGGTVTAIGNGQALSFRPTQPWARGALVEVFLDSSALDTEGNALNNYQGSFRVAANPAANLPTISAFAPTYPTTVSGGVPINAAIDILFSEPLDASSVNSTNVILRDAQTSVVIAATVSLRNGGQVVRVQPQSLLTPNRQHYVQLLSGLKDTTAQTLQFTQNLFFSTSTAEVADTVAPHVVSMSPPSGAGGVGVNAQVHARFDEPINPFTLTMTPQQTTFGSVFWSDNNREVRFVRHEPYAANTQVTESFASAEDYAGNAVATPNSTTFTTGASADVVTPAVQDGTPFNAAQNVAVNAVVKVLFNEPLDPVSVNTSTVYVYDTVLGTNVTASATLEADGRTVTVVPKAAYLVGRTYYVYTYGVRDLSGNELYTYRYFTTAFAPDSQAPSVTDSSVLNGLTGVPTNAVLQVSFSEPINGLKLTGVVLRQGGQVAPATLQLSGDHRVLTFKQVQPLSANTSYVLSVSGIEDLSGNVLAVNRTVSFTAGAGVDLVAPALVTRSPVPGATGVPRNTQIEVQLNERINPVTVSTDSLRLYDSTTGLFIEGTHTLSADGASIRFVPSETLVPNRLYYFYVGYSAVIEDLAGNRMSTNWTFTTGSATDATAPQVLLQSVADGATGVPINGRLALRFDAALADRCVNGQTVQVSTGGVTVAGTLTLSSDRTQLTFTPQAALAANTAYTLRLQGLCDLAGNTLNNFSSGFTTSASAAPDSTRPTVGITPAQGATNVPVTTAITMTFSEPIDVTTLASGMQMTVSGLSGEVAGELAVNGNIVTFTPLNPLPGNKTIFMTVNGVFDLAGNQVVGVTRQFTTGAAGDATVPRILSISPSDGLADAAPGTPIVITFSESLDASTIDNSSLALFVNGDIVRPGVSRSQDNRTIVLTSSLPVSSVVSVIATNQIRDLSGNRLADFVSAFTTAAASDVTRPSVVTQFPGNGASGVRLNADIILYANESLDASSVQQALHVSQNGAIVNGTITTAGSGQIVRFHPSQPWTGSALVEVFFDNSALDGGGNPLQNYKGTFRVVTDPATAVPTVAGFAPSSLPGGVPVNAALDALFSEPLDAATVTSANVVLRDASNGQVVASTVSRIKLGLVVRVRPQAPLQPSHGYYLALSTGLQDTNGQALQFGQNLFFSTNAVAVADTQAPHVSSVSPPNGATGVGLNAHSHWRFDEPITPFSVLFDPAQPGGTIFWSDNNRELRVVWEEPLAANTQLTDSMAPAQDYAGNAVLAPNSTTYTTGNSADVTDPTVVNATPFTGATNVPVNPVVRALFSEQIDPVSVNASTVYLYDTQTGNNVAPNVTLEPDGRTVTLVPSAALLNNRLYYFYMYGVRDLAGNQVFTYRYFTTGFAADTQAPVVTVTSVRDAQTAVPTNAVLQVKFDEPVNSLKLQGVVLRVGGQVVPASLDVSGDHRVITFKPVQPLLASTGYAITVSGVEDLSGNVLAVNSAVGFTTGVGADLTAPTIATRTPAAGATAVPRNIAIEAQLSELLNPVALSTDVIRLYDSSTGQFVAGTVTLNPDGATVRFVPTALLDANRLYYFYVGYSASIEDLAGNRYGISWTFTTGAQ
jgi:hypothetical protein